MKTKKILKIKIITIGFIILLQSCVSKKEILYLQDLDSYTPTELSYNNSEIQVDDVLKITIGTLMPEAAIPFNKNFGELGQQNQNIELMILEGYLVSQGKTINFPVLGTISVDGKTTNDLEKYLKERLESGGYLIDPIVMVRLLNAKVTILGEVNIPGTFNFTENNMSFLQALGLAGDLTINGNREDIIIIRSIDGIQTTSHLNLTSADWLSSPYQNIKSNDVIVVNPNAAMVKSAGFIGNASVVLAMASIILSSIVILTNL
ncbi:polysaccharide biosynthesis/export family protein [Flavobacteriaceae bacterium]|nr:polysaccharide biosynthesis/export family protein [Flavobacteriaceae bacterium]